MKKLILATVMAASLALSAQAGVFGSGVTPPYDLLAGTGPVNVTSTASVCQGNNTTNETVVPLKAGCGITLFPLVFGPASGATASNATFNVALSDWTGTNWTTSTPTLSGTITLNGGTPVRGLLVLTAAQVGSAKSLAVGCLSTTCTNAAGIWFSNCTWAYQQ